jgi:predicted DNA-binding protein with PD1-like motif
MTFAKVNQNTYIIRLEKDEEIIASIQKMAQDEQITNAKIEGLGSIKNPTLAHYRLDTKKYSEKQIDGLFEITTLLGNIGVFDAKPVVHAHITIGNEEMQLFGGHLVKGEVSATVELIITTYPTKYEKKFDEEIGLKLWNLKNN